MWLQSVGGVGQLKVVFDRIIERLLSRLPTPIFLGLIAIAVLFGGFWVFTYRPDLVPIDILLDPRFVVGALIIIFFVVGYYAVQYIRHRPKKTAPDRIGIWLAQIEGDSQDSYLRDLKGQIEGELTSDSNLKNVEIRIYPEMIHNHDEARREGEALNAKAVVWGNLGEGLDGGRVSNLKLTILGGPMNLQTDVQFRSEVDLSGYEVRDVARFVAGYTLLSSGQSIEAMVHFDRILDGPEPSLFKLADALQFGGIASYLATQRSINSRDLLEKAKRYFAKYTNLWSEDRDPLPRAMGFFNLGSVEYRLRDDSSESINEALRLYDEAAKLFSRGGNDEGHAMVQVEVAHILSDLYQMHNQPAYGTGAHIRLEEAAKVIEKEEDPRLYAGLMFERGRLFTRMGYGLSGIPAYFGKAVEAFEEAIEVYHQLGKYPVDTALAVLHWGGARISMEGIEDEQRQGVLDAYKQAASIAYKEGFPGIYAEIQTSICAVLLELPATAPNLQAAVEAGDEALAIHTSGENSIEYARACRNHAQACIAYSSLQKISDDEAVRYLEAALRSAEGALRVVGPNFYPNYHRHACELVDETKKKLTDRGATS